ncbi:MAG: aminoglycoside N(3)-acetyltransferase [Chloroflexi bacterium]|nr:MAG: aminoglycoside N(3)-acetyltransferase [Chloroflexota bacterium]
MQVKQLREKKFNKDQLIAQLHGMGIQTGDALVVHSAYSTIGKVAGGPDTVIDALLEAVGTDGHLMFPAFSFHIDTGPYDPATSPTTMGIIPETARKRPQFYRSDFPRNSVIVAGPRAAQIAENHVSRGHCRAGDPFDRVAMMGGWVMLLGVGFRNNTMVHIGECYADLPHRRPSLAGPYIPLDYADGRQVLYNASGGPQCSEGFAAVEGIMRERNHIIDGYVGVSPVKLMKGKDVIFDTVDLLKRAPWALYCNNPECHECAKNRQTVMQELLERKRRDEPCG